MKAVSLYDRLLRPLLFRLDPERAHEIAMAALARGFVPGRAIETPSLVQQRMGLTFPNPIGLAAGLDKNAHAASGWGRLGFGFAELGTITALPQPGNPKPRLFRLPEDRALINRMGFNNDGAEAVAKRLARARSSVPIGINLGKSKLTPLEEAADDYRRSFAQLKERGDYFVINVSSPNTPGLRTLQEKGPLLEIVAAIRELDPGAEKPLLVKVAPDLELSALDEVIEVAHTAGLSGLIATNTTLSREGLHSVPNREEAGGLSGAPLRERANRFLRHLALSCDPHMTLIGVGGIFCVEHLVEKIALGAHLCQIYTSFIYQGPTFPSSLARDLVAWMEREGVQTLDELRSSALKAP